jgi:ubiquitin thioesterase protein OTUB1
VRIWIVADPIQILTSVYMQFHPQQYQNFLDTTVHDYCKSRIEANAQEIDQIGLQALTDGIIAPAGIAVEVLYLDRSEGNEVTPHSFVPQAVGLPTIRLLYRPQVTTTSRLCGANS